MEDKIMTVRGKCLVERYNKQGALMSRELLTNLVMKAEDLGTLKAVIKGLDGSINLVWMPTGVHNA